MQLKITEKTKNLKNMFVPVGGKGMFFVLYYIRMESVKNMKIHMSECGMEANPAFLGLGLLMLGFFNLMFFHVYYRNPNKVGKAFFAGAVGSGVYMVIAEALTHVAPLFRDCLDTTGGEYVFHKSVTLVAGIIGYVILTYLSYKKSGKVFDKIDL